MRMKRPYWFVRHESACEEAVHTVSRHRSERAAVRAAEKATRDFARANPPSAGVSCLCGYAVYLADEDGRNHRVGVA